MVTASLTRAQPDDESVAESSLDIPAELWAPPLAPIGAAATSDIHLREEPLGSATRDGEAFLHAQESDFTEPQARFGSRAKLIAGAAGVAALGIAALAYFWTSPAEKTAAPAAQTAAAVQSSPKAPEETAPKVPGPSPDTTSAVAWPDLPASATVDTPPQVAAAAPVGSIPARQPAGAAQSQELLFLQKPGVNIRSTPSPTGTVVGTAAKGTRFKVASREGDWVQVESTRIKGWIKSQFLASSKPR